MRTLSSLISAINKINVGDICSNSIDQTKEDLLEKNKEQLYDGKLRTEEDLSPSYLEDPYFKSAAAAQRYSDWKDRITPNSKRNKGIPNLFINGTFYDSLSISVSKDSISMDSSFSEASDIESKFTTNIFSLGGQYKSNYLNEFVKPLVFELLTTELNEK